MILGLVPLHFNTALRVYSRSYWSIISQMFQNSNNPLNASVLFLPNTTFLQMESSWVDDAKFDMCTGIETIFTFHRSCFLSNSLVPLSMGSCYDSQQKCGSPTWLQLGPRKLRNPHTRSRDYLSNIRKIWENQQAPNQRLEENQSWGNWGARKFLKEGARVDSRDGVHSHR